MNLDQAESRLGIVLPGLHRKVMNDPLDPIHGVCDFLILDSVHEWLRWLDVNTFLHADGRLDRWPDFLIAFASNGCGDYFAYDLQSKPPRILYVDPDRTVEENLEQSCGLVFDSFESWYDMKLELSQARR